MGDAEEPIADDELLYRRVHLTEYDPAIDPKVSPQAFRPRRYDETGLSLYRAKHATAEDVAANSRGKKYYVAVVRAGDLRRHGMQIEPAPGTEGGPAGHAEIVNLTYRNRKEGPAMTWQILLAEELCFEVIGPLPL